MPGRATLFRFSPPRLAGWMLLLWFVLEVVAFALLVDRLGVLTTIGLGLALTVLGVIRLRRIGFAAAMGMRAAMDGRQPREGALLDGALAALGALLLILPGFVSDAAGLALSLPAVRQRLIARYAVPVPLRRRSEPGVVDLDAREWHPVDQPRLP